MFMLLVQEKSFGLWKAIIGVLMRVRVGIVVRGLLLKFITKW